MTAKRDHHALRNLAALLKKLADAIQEEEGGEYWAGVIETFRLDTERLLASRAGWKEQQALATEIRSIYGGMGSFNDTWFSDETEQMQEQLYELTINLLRDAWRGLHPEVTEVPDGECFKVGDKVKLREGETIHLEQDGTRTPAPESPLIYTVRERYPNDIDNIPRYFIQADSHCRVARHNALEPAVSAGRK